MSQIAVIAQEPKKQKESGITRDKLFSPTVLKQLVLFLVNTYGKQWQSVQGPLAYFTSNNAEQMHLCYNFLGVNYSEDHIQNPKI